MKTNNIIWAPLLLALYNLTANLSNDIYLPSMPNVQETLGTHLSLVQFTMTAWFAGVTIPQLILGPCTDRFGRKPVIFLGALCFVMATLCCIFAPNIKMLIISRFFQGVGVCSLNVSNFSILSDLYQAKKRVKIISYVNAFAGCSPLLGPIVGGYLLIYFGWRSSFWCIFLLGFLISLGILFKLQETNRQLKPEALNFKKLYQNYSSLLKNKSFLKYFIPYSFIGGGTMAYSTGAPFLIIKVIHLDPQYFGYTQVPQVMTGMLTTFFVGYAASHLNIDRVLKIGLGLLLFSTVFLLFLGYWKGNQLQVPIVGMMFYSTGTGLCSAPLISKAMSINPQLKGATAALLGFGMAISCALASSLISVFYNGTLVSIASVMCFLVLTSIMVFLLKPQ